MRIQFLGTGAAEGFPAIFCNCPSCTKIKYDRREHRTRSQVLIDGILSVDFPPEAYAHALANGIDLSSLQYVLATHSHMDHFYAHDFILRGYKYAQLATPLLSIYGNREVCSVFNECTRREMKPTVAPHLQMVEVEAYQKLKIGDYTVLTLPAHHSVQEQALLFYIGGDKGYLHFYDTGRLLIDDPFVFLSQNGAHAHVVCFDCTFMENTGGEGARHMGLADIRLMQEKLRQYGVVDDDTQYVITHFSHNANPTRQRAETFANVYGFIAAYDGLEMLI